MIDSQKYEKLGWPARENVMAPKGGGAEVIVQLAKRKIEKALRRRPDAEGVEVGILSNNPETSEAPLAIVCEFPSPVNDETLLYAQKLGWNFSRSLLLVTIEPHIIRKWSCCEHPVDFSEWRRQKGASLDNAALDTPQIQPSIPFDTSSNEFKSEKAARSLHWMELISGHFFEQNPGRFPLDKRADRMLLKNLKEVRNCLRDQGLEDQFSHDLLARIIFVQFLFDRKDSGGRAALNKELLHELHYGSGELSQPYDDLEDILRNYDDAYALFERLNEIFNGDLFPGNSQVPDESRKEWRQEKSHVSSKHLRYLADFVSGKVEFESGQRSLWPLYSFDAIPLEFISSIYEEFVSKEEGTGIHYTPGHIVDFMLDRVLPWNSTEWNLRILDPACGSGIFLVKAYQRLIHRWKKAHPDQSSIPPAILRKLLEENLFGMDKDSDAARVASFSLYLAMCDEIDPRDYWRDAMKVKFPQLRGRRILGADFFGVTEDTGGEGFPEFDLVVGNPPFGKNTVDRPAERWMNTHSWSVPNNDVGTLFLAKAAEITSPGGRICMVQSASVLLSMRGSTGLAHRRRIFLGFAKVRSVTNLSAFRPFKEVSVPACILEFENVEPDGESFWYECPKRTKTSQDAHHFIIEPHDVHQLYPEEVVEEPWVWSVLMWGGQRDRALLRRLNRFPSINSLEKEGYLKTRRGVIRSNREREIDELYGRPLFEKPIFPDLSKGLHLNAESLPRVQSKAEASIYSRDSTDFSAFATPQMLIKMSWRKDPARYQARLVKSDQGVICSRAYVTVHSEATDSGILGAACLAYNSQLANYYFLLTSARFAFDRAEPTKKQLLTVPLPGVSTKERRLEAASSSEKGKSVIEDVENFKALDRLTFDLFNFNKAESILIEDMVTYTLADWKNLSETPGREPTIRTAKDGKEEPDLWNYCSVLEQVLKAGYGSQIGTQATIFAEGEGASLPVRLIAIQLTDTGESNIEVEEVGTSLLHRQLEKAQEIFARPAGRYNYHQRCIRSFDYEEASENKKLVVYMLKPDQMRYWTRSMAMRDADALAADLRTWSTSSGETSEENEIVPA